MTPSDPMPLSLFRWVFAGLQAAGASTQEFSRETGWQPIDDPDAQVPCATATALIDGAIRLTDDPAFGLHSARQLGLAELGPAMAACGAVRTSAELLRQLARFLRLHGSVMELRVGASNGGQAVSLAFSPPSLDRAARAASEFALGAVALAIRARTDDPRSLTAVHFRHAAPSFRQEYDELFQCPVRFGAGSLHLEFVAEPVPRRSLPSPTVSDFVFQCADRAIARLPVVGPSATAVRRFLASQFPWGIPSMTQTATGLGQTVPGLYELLQPEGTAFARLREELLSELACEYIADATLSTAEAAHLLGFTELSVFERSFERWRRTTLKEFRERARAGASG